MGGLTTATWDAETRTIHWAKLPWEEDYSHHKSGWIFCTLHSSLLACAAQHGLTLYVSLKVQATGCNTRPSPADLGLLIHAIQSHTAEECQLNPDLIETLLNFGYDPLARWQVDQKSFSAWSVLLDHDAGMEPPDPRWERWKKIAAMFVTHLHSLKQISTVEGLIGATGDISPLSVSFVRQLLKEKAEQLAKYRDSAPVSRPEIEGAVNLGF